MLVQSPLLAQILFFEFVLMRVEQLLFHVMSKALLFGLILMCLMLILSLLCWELLVNFTTYVILSKKHIAILLGRYSFKERTGVTTIDDEGNIGTANFGPSPSDSPSWLIKVFLVLYLCLNSLGVRD